MLKEIARFDRYHPVECSRWAARASCRCRASARHKLKQREFADQFAARMHVEAGIDFAAVVIGGVLANVQSLADRGERVTRGQQQADLHLPAGERQVLHAPQQLQRQRSSLRTVMPTSEAGSGRPLFSQYTRNVNPPQALRHCHTGGAGNS